VRLPNPTRLHRRSSLDLHRLAELSTAGINASAHEQSPVNRTEIHEPVSTASFVETGDHPRRCLPFSLTRVEGEWRTWSPAELAANFDASRGGGEVRTMERPRPTPSICSFPCCGDISRTERELIRPIPGGVLDFEDHASGSQTAVTRTSRRLPCTSARCRSNSSGNARGATVADHGDSPGSGPV